MDQPSRGEAVRVHFNLRTGLWSVSVKIPGKGWRVRFNVQECSILGATPKVSSPGIATVRRHNRRRVIAQIQGTWLDDRSREEVAGRLKFNPHYCDSFMLDGEPWTGSDIVTFTRTPADAVSPFGARAFEVAC